MSENLEVLQTEITKTSEELRQAIVKELQLKRRTFEIQNEILKQEKKCLSDMIENEKRLNMRGA